MSSVQIVEICHNRVTHFSWSSAAPPFRLSPQNKRQRTAVRPEREARNSFVCFTTITFVVALLYFLLSFFRSSLDIIFLLLEHIVADLVFSLSQVFPFSSPTSGVSMSSNNCIYGRPFVQGEETSRPINQRKSSFLTPPVPPPPPNS